MTQSSHYSLLRNVPSSNDIPVLLDEEKVLSPSIDHHKEEDSMASFLFLFTLLFLVVVAASFVTEVSYLIGNRTYTERMEQPWFRHPHYDHQRIEASEADKEGFAKHFVPTDDVFIPPQWNWKEQKYTPCMNRLCLCSFFNGTKKEGECHLKNKRGVLKRGRRQELRSMTEKDRTDFVTTLNWMKSSGMYNRLMRIHKYSGVHSGPAFTIWHREYLKRIELIIRRYLPDPNMGIPYWDSTLDAMLPDPHDSIMFSDIFLGQPDDDGLVRNGPYANWTTMEGRTHILRQFRSDTSGELLNNARIDWVVNNPDINMVLGTSGPLTTCSMNHSLDARMLEYSHDYVHFFVSGDMGRSHSSSNDVIFIYHHSMVDWIYEQYRQTMQTREERLKDYPPFDENCFAPWHAFDAHMPMLRPFRNSDALSDFYSEEIFEYAPRPTCSRKTPDCGSLYLFCYITNNADEDPYCMSKVKSGGNCSGFEDTQICYKGKCEDGVCIKTELKKKDHLKNLITKHNKDTVNM